MSVIDLDNLPLLDVSSFKLPMFFKRNIRENKRIIQAS